ncbi:NAD(P)-binding protein [Pholiota conissans]|uniref:NAD(P)-binding protein n=1 Tax=Pholiota conissans TaxID=109636 RepID=A0A9P6D837_9AGAR|nr:NAD(P)-binding protein [Pholiota conissans]
MASTTEILGGLTAGSMFNLQGVVAVVTGGGTGIGLMISSTIVANGGKVYIVGPQQKELDRIAEIYNQGTTTGMGSMHGVEADIRQKSEATRVAALINAREPHGITVLFNNAGILKGQFTRPEFSPSDPPNAQAFVDALFDPVSQEDFNDVFNTNAVGPYWFTFAFLPLLEKWKSSPGGKKFVPQVIMTSSMNGWTKDAATSGFTFPYLFSKSAIGHATSTLAHELLPLGIRVNGIAPGLFPSEMSNPGSIDDKGINTIAPETKIVFEVPANHAGGTRHDMGALVLFLVANWFVNGETVLIDGGTLLKHPSSY